MTLILTGERTELRSPARPRPSQELSQGDFFAVFIKQLDLVDSQWPIRVESKVIVALFVDYFGGGIIG